LTVEACLGGKSITLSRFAQKIPRAISKKHEFPARHYIFILHVQHQHLPVLQRLLVFIG